MDGINYSASKKFLISTGMRASADGTTAMQKAINEYAKTLAEKAKDVAEAKKKKTISSEHISVAMKELIEN